MPMLGDMLAAAREASGNFELWLQRSEPELASEIKHVAAERGMTSTQYVRSAVADFARFAPEEDWATLTSRLREANDPGTICLLTMVQWRLTAPGCDEHCYR